MRKVLPMVWKYLLVVATSCSLAFIIAQTDANAEAAVSAAAAGAAAKDYAAAGAFSVESSEASWQDANRSREVPVRIYLPQGDKTGKAARYPVILFSHGLGGSRAGGKTWAEHWASHGYVVVAIQHPGSDESIWKGKPQREIAQAMKDGITVTNLGLRVGDVGFVIDEIVRRAAAKVAPFDIADPSRLGMSGHSFGSQTTLAVAGQKSPGLSGQSGLDTRIVSAIALSPNARDKTKLERQFGDIRIPLFSITGTEDGSILGDGTRYQDRMLPYEHMPPGGKYLAVFDGGDHMIFGGHTLGARRKETARDRAIQEDVKAGTLAFWDSTLKKDAAAQQWLAGGGFKAMLDAKDTFASK